MILVTQFRQDRSIEHEQACIQAKMPDAQVVFRSAFDPEVDFSHPQQLLRGVTKLVLGGSGQFNISERDTNPQVAHAISTVRPLVEHVLEADFPTFGICFGHQMLGHIACGGVTHEPTQAETGYFDVELTPEGRTDFLFEGIPDTFSVVELHKESVTDLPDGATVLAKSRRCPVQALAFGKRVRGAQFHAELNAERLEERLMIYPDYRKYIGTAATAPQAGDWVLRNFLKAEF